jgi:hypothetical protein
MPDEKIARRRARVAAEAADRRARRVAGTRRRDAVESAAPVTDDSATELVVDLIETSALLPEPTDTDIVESDVVDTDVVESEPVETADEAVEVAASDEEDSEAADADAVAAAAPEDAADDATEEDGN